MFFRRMLFTNYQTMNKIVEEDTSSGNGALWLGDYTAASDKRLLKEKNIKTVLTTASGLGISYLPGDGIVHRQYNLLDMPSQNIIHTFDSTYKEIDEGLKRGSVLVHCAAGISRSATCLIAYLMKKNGSPFRETLTYVRNRRRVACPNVGFERQLKQFESQLMKAQRRQQSDEQQDSIQGQQSATAYGKMNNTQPRFPAVTDLFDGNSSQMGAMSVLGNSPNIGGNKIMQRSSYQKNWRIQPMNRSIMGATSSQKQDGLQVFGMHKSIGNNSSPQTTKNQKPSISDLKFNSGPNIVTYSSRNDMRTSSRGPVPIHQHQTSLNGNANKNSNSSNLATLSNFRRRPVKNIYYV